MRSLCTARDVSVSRPACSTSARTIRGWRCPWFKDEYALMQSRYLRPSTSQAHTPSARAITTGSGA